MKLNYKRTILVGFAFFLISAFWQAYDATIALTLTNKFGMSQTWSGVIMALDNILALFMLPIFGTLSDKHLGKSGRRTPFIRFGTLLAAIVLVALSFADGMQLKQLNTISDINNPAHLETLYQEEKDSNLITPNGEKYALSSTYDVSDYVLVRTDTTMMIYESQEGEKQTFAVCYYGEDNRNALALDTQKASQISISGKNIPLYYSTQDVEKIEFKNKIAEITVAGETMSVKLLEQRSPFVDYVLPAIQHYAAEKTAENPTPLILFIGLLLVLLVAMATFRSPAVALMPDVTIKPLRSKANAIINLMGTAGGILILGLGLLFKTSDGTNSLMDYRFYWSVVACLMVVALITFLSTVKEPQWAAQMQSDAIRYGVDEKEEAAVSGEKRKLNKAELKSLILILLSVALWYFGYNAVTSKYSVYAPNVLQKNYNTTMLIAQGAAIVAYLPAGMVASKIGRRKTILAGVLMLCTAFGVAATMTASSPDILMNIMFALAGVAWATINVNSFPMVVELSSGSDVGKYTGFYYTASMAAQTVTPMLSGFLMDKLGMKVLFPYAAIFVALAFVTMLMVRHGDAKAVAKKGLEALDIED